MRGQILLVVEQVRIVPVVVGLIERRARSGERRVIHLQFVRSLLQPVVFFRFALGPGRRRWTLGHVRASIRLTQRSFPRRVLGQVENLPRVRIDDAHSSVVGCNLERYASGRPRAARHDLMSTR